MDDSVIIDTESWGNNNVRLLATITVLAAYLVHRFFFVSHRTSGPPPDKATSRLLQERFGTVPTDLYLKEEEEEEDNGDDDEDEKVNQPNGQQNVVATEIAATTSEPNPAPASKQANESETSTPHRIARKEKKQTPKRSPSPQIVVSNQSQNTPEFCHSSDDHPGLKHYWHWFDVEASLYRIYTIMRSDGNSKAPPYNPSSARGKVPVHLRVTNEWHLPIAVFWINYKGGHESKGTIAPGHTWFQQTWIDHPWVFCLDDEETTELLHYIPYRVIPNVSPEAETMERDDPRQVGVHRFGIGRPIQEPYRCSVQDNIFPHPAQHFIDTAGRALELALLHCLRTDYAGWEYLKKYVQMILLHPDQTKYRQIRIANVHFGGCVWNTAARGVLLAAGFVENLGHAELGTSQPLAGYRVSELSFVLNFVERSQRRLESMDTSEQPEGADGYGRAGYRR